MSVGYPTLNGGIYRHLEQGVVAMLERYTPAGAGPDWKKVENFVRDAVAIASTRSTRELPPLLQTTAKFVLWCTAEQGLPLESAVIFAPQTIDVYCTQLMLRAATRSTYRSSLLLVSRAVIPEAHNPKLTPMHHRVVKSPYSPTEMDRNRAWAKGQHTQPNREKAKLLLAFSAGARLGPAEIGAVRRDDLTIDDAGVVIRVHGSKARDVPLLKGWERWVVRIAESRHGDDPMWSSKTVGDNRNFISHFTQVCLGEAPNSFRLRATWITSHLRLGTPMKELFRAGGMTQFTNLHQYLDYVDEADATEYRSLLRGARK
jgi:integrase